MKDTFYASLSILFAVVILFAGLAAWLYIGRAVWNIISMAFG